MARLGSRNVVNIEDLRRLARRRLPQAVFDYLDGGAADEVTLRENCRAFEQVLLRPRQAVAHENCDLRTRVLGHDISFPAMLAPVGYSRLMHPDGEVAAARAAGEIGTGFILSTISGHKMEKVKAASSGPVWYQLYLVGGHAAAEAAIERARVAGFSALVITIDTPVAGMRERDVRNGVKELMGDSLLAKIPLLPELLGASSMARCVSARWRGAETGEHRDAWARGDADDGCGGCVGEGRCDLGGLALVAQGVGRADRREGCTDGRRRATGDRRGRQRRGGIQSWGPATGWRGAYVACFAGNCCGGEWASGSADGWRCSPRLRHRESDLHGSASRAGGACIRVWARRRGARRSRASARDITV